MQALTACGPGGFDLGANAGTATSGRDVGMNSPVPKQMRHGSGSGPSTGQFVVVIENSSGTVAYCGTGAREVVGVSVGSSLVDHIHGEDASTFLSTLAAVIASGSQIQIVYRIRTAEGQYRLYEAICRPTSAEYASVAGTGGVTVVSTPVGHDTTQQQDGYIAHSHHQPPITNNNNNNTTLWARRRMQQHDLTSPPLSVVTGSANDGYGETLVTPSLPTSASSLTYSGASTMSYTMMPYGSAHPPTDDEAVYMDNMWTPVMSGYHGLAAKYPYGAGPDGLTNSSSEDMGDEGPRSPVAIAPPSYWDNITNSELVSPQFYYQNVPYGPGGQYYMDYQTPTMDFSPGYSVATKKSPTVGNKSATTRRKSKHSSDGVDGVPSYVCSECGAVESPEWRKGPQGPKTLCNACGLRWAKKTRKEEGSSISPPSRKR
jgi:hypothetical protein